MAVVERMILTSILLSFLVSSLLIASGEEDRIQQINSISQVSSYIEPKVLLVFDLDNTIFQASRSDCHANIFYERVRTGEDPVEVYQLWETSQESCPVSAVEGDTPSWIRGLQQQGISMIGLTSRGFTALEATKRQLESIAVNLALTAPGASWENYDSGVLFVSVKKAKGDQLLDFLKAQGQDYARVVMVDDLRKNLESVDQALKRAQIPFSGLYYPLVTNPAE